MKIASVIHLHKEGEKSEPNNVGPISLFPTLGKILEKNNLNRIFNYFKNFEILNSNQFGFREKRGTVDAVSTLVELIWSSKHSYTEHTYCSFLDLRKAFDTADRKILLQKCKMYGTRGPVYVILESFLKNRKQFVQSGQRKSQMTEVKYGVPQGSILGPLVFIVYINDLKTNSPCSNFIFYADDTAVYKKSNKANSCWEHQQILSQTGNWLKMNKVTLKTDKCKTITLMTKRDRSDVFTMNGKRLENLNSLSYLGITVDKKLCFREHLKRVEKNLVQFCGLFYKLRKILNRSQLIEIFNTYVKPVIQYGNLVCGTANKATMQKIDAKLNRILRVMFFSKVWLSFSLQREIQRIFGPGASSERNFLNWWQNA